MKTNLVVNINELRLLHQRLLQQKIVAQLCLIYFACLPPTVAL